LDCLRKYEERYRELWEGRPFKGALPKEEYNDEKYLENKERIRGIDRDLKMIVNPERIDFRKRFHDLYGEYSGLVREVIENEEYRRVFGEKEPRDVDLSKGKLSRGLNDKIRRIKEIIEEKDEYEKMDKCNNMMEEGSIVGNVQVPSPIHTIDTRNRFSVLRHYNRGASNEFVEKNIEILRNAETDEVIDRRMEEREREGRRRGET